MTFFSKARQLLVSYTYRVVDDDSTVRDDASVQATPCLVKSLTVPSASVIRYVFASGLDSTRPSAPGSVVYDTPSELRENVTQPPPATFACAKDSCGNSNVVYGAADGPPVAPPDQDGPNGDRISLTDKLSQ
jgi:hypothetical protein